MASLSSNGGPTQRRRRRKAKGTKSVLAKLEESLKDGDFYSALQMYKTLLSRTSPKEVKNESWEGGGDRIPGECCPESLY